MKSGRDGLRLVGSSEATSSANGSAEHGSAEHDMEVSGQVPLGETEQALLASGIISVDEYMDMMVARALHHLLGQVSTARFDQMAKILRAELEQEPTLVALMRQVASGE